jgi:hypothetical protein
MTLTIKGVVVYDDQKAISLRDASKIVKLGSDLNEIILDGLAFCVCDYEEVVDNGWDYVVQKRDDCFKKILNIFIEVKNQVIINNSGGIIL